MYYIIVEQVLRLVTFWLIRLVLIFINVSQIIG